MYSQKINAVANKLAVLAGSIPEDQWKLLRACRAELLDAAEGVLQMEKTLCFPPVEQPGAGDTVQTAYGAGVVTSSPDRNEGMPYVEFEDGSGCSVGQILPEERSA